MASVVKLQPARIRSWLNRVPLFTRVVLFLVTVLYIVSIFFDELPLAGALIPAEITLLKSRSVKALKESTWANHPEQHID